MREESEKLLSVLAENVEALVGQSVEVRQVSADSEEMAKVFGGQKLYCFPVEDHQSAPLPSMLVMDIPAAVHTGAAFSLMGQEQVKEVLDSGEIPEILHDSIGEVANILCGAAVNVLRETMPEAPEYRRGSEFKVMEAPPWPGLLAEVDDSHPWDLVGGIVLIDGEERGGLLLASSDRSEGMISSAEIIAAAGGSSETDDLDTSDSAGEASAQGTKPAAGDGESPAAANSQRFTTREAEDDVGNERIGEEQTAESTGTSATAQIPPGMKIHITCHPADPGARALKTLLEEAGAKVLMATPACANVEVLFVISRSPTDMKIRLKSLANPARRPALVIACSDRPTRDIVVAARAGLVDHFVVLPTNAEMLAELVTAVPEDVV